MAITLITQTGGYRPVYNEMVYTASSDNVGEDSFTYIVDVYINGNATKEIRLPIPPNPDGFLFVDIHRVIEQSLGYTLVELNTTTASVSDTNGVATYQVKIGEQYEVLGVLTTFEDLNVGTVKTCFGGSLDRNEAINFNPLEYLSFEFISKFLTNEPTSKNINIDSYGTTSIFNYFSIGEQLLIQTYDSSNTLIGSFKIDVTPSVVNILPSAPKSLNAIDTLEFNFGTQPIIIDSVDSYTIELLDATNTQVSERKTFKINRCENKASFIFLNKFNQFDTFDFTKRKDVNTSIERATYKKINNTLSGSGAYTPSSSDREKVQHYTKTTSTIKVVSDWITEEENEWILELIASPVIYMLDGTNLVSIEKCTKTMHESKNAQQDKLFNMELEFSLGYDNYRQRN
jgi:hypothetical protein